MDDTRKGPDEGSSRVRQAIRWFIDNGSDREPDSKTLLQWESWCDDPENFDVYREVVDLQLLALSVVPLDVPSREALLADVKRGAARAVGGWIGRLRGVVANLIAARRRGSEARTKPQSLACRPI